MARPDVTIIAWEALLRAHRRLVDDLSVELCAGTGLDLDAYDVLYQLARAPGGARRMSDLADHLLVSRSSCTRLVDRLVGDGLVQRETDAADRRVVTVSLTTAGRRAQRRAAAVHLRGIRRLLAERLTAAELVAVGTALTRLAEPQGRAPCPDAASLR